jgi:two-component system, NarL family, nitrate/nitrite response regulator NarL
MRRAAVQLTPRERDVLVGIVDGRRNREIAEMLGIKEQSVRNILSGMYAKCYVRNRLELLTYAVRHDLLSH